MPFFLYNGILTLARRHQLVETVPKFYLWVSICRLCIWLWKHFPHYWSLRGESIGHQWFPSQRASNDELWCLFVVSLNTQSSCRWFETPRGLDVTVITQTNRCTLFRLTSPVKLCMWWGKQNPGQSANEVVTMSLQVAFYGNVSLSYGWREDYYHNCVFKL